jgi:hypothetical protein
MRAYSYCPLGVTRGSELITPSDRIRSKIDIDRRECHGSYACFTFEDAYANI